MEAIQFITSLLILGGIVFGIYHYFRNPDIRNDQSIRTINERCKMTHANLDKSIMDIEKNHLRHIENNIRKMELNIAKILTIQNIQKESMKELRELFTDSIKQKEK